MPTLEERLQKAQQSETLEQRLAKAQAAPPEAEQSRTKTGAFLDIGGRGLANLTLGIPAAIGDVLGGGLAGTAAALKGGTAVLESGDIKDFDFNIRANEEIGKFPASLLDSIPKFTVEGAAAGIRSLPELIPGGETFSQRKEIELADFLKERDEIREEFPGIAFAGDVAGDVAGIFRGRASFSKAIKAAEKTLAGLTTKLTGTGLLPLAEAYLKGPAAKVLAKGAGRTLEVGLEATALDIVKGDDPFETAGYLMGAQVVESGILQTFKVAKANPLWTGALAVAGTWQIVKGLTPGGDNSIIESIESGFDKVTFGLAIGALATMAGGGRRRGFKGKLETKVPQFADQLGSTPRLAVIAVVDQLFHAPPEERDDIETVINKLVDDPIFFGKEITLRLQNAMEGGRFAEELRELQKDRKFRQKLFSLQPPDLSIMPELSDGE